MTSSFENVYDLFYFIIFSLIVATVIVSAWFSTYVPEQPIAVTAVVIIQEETLNNLEMQQQGQSQPSTSSEPSETPPDNEVPTSGVQEATENSERSSGRTLEEPSTTTNEIVNENRHSVEDTSSGSDCPDAKVAPKESSISDDNKPSCSKTVPVSLQSSKKHSTDTLKENDVTLSSIEEIEPTTSGARKRIKKSKNVDNKDKPSLLIDKSSSKSLVTSSNASSEAAGSSTSNGAGENLEVTRGQEPGSIKIKLKFLDDTQKHVWGHLTGDIGQFKRTHFESQMAENCAVRLIFNGQLLNRDSFTLAQYGLFHNCVVHCHISQPMPRTSDPNRPADANEQADELDLSEFLSPVLFGLVGFLWYLRFIYSHLFNHSATFILLCLTVLLFLSRHAFSISFNVTLSYPRNNDEPGAVDEEASSNSSASGGSTDSNESGIDEETDLLTEDMDASEPGFHPSRLTDSEPGFRDSILTTESTQPEFHDSMLTTKSTQPEFHDSMLTTESTQPVFHDAMLATESTQPGFCTDRLATDSREPGFHAARLSGSKLGFYADGLPDSEYEFHTDRLTDSTIDNYESPLPLGSKITENAVINAHTTSLRTDDNDSSVPAGKYVNLPKPRGATNIKDVRNGILYRSECSEICSSATSLECSTEVKPLVAFGHS